jgi:hypothetical protein
MEARRTLGIACMSSEKIIEATLRLVTGIPVTSLAKLWML